MLKLIIITTRCLLFLTIALCSYLRCYAKGNAAYIEECYYKSYAKDYAECNAKHNAECKVKYNAKCYAEQSAECNDKLYCRQYAEKFRQDTTIDSKTLKINEVVVSASRIRKEVIPVQELSGVELKRLNVYSVADAVRYFSGVQVKDYGGIGGLKTVNIRSMGSHHVGVFYDGVELGNAQNGVIDLGRFSLDNMESITMYNGQKSAIFQPAKDYASASSIYMTTRRPVFSNEKRYNINVGIKGGSFATINPSVL